MEELKMLVTQTNGTIKTNFLEMSNAVKSIADAYAGLEVTETNKTERKKDIATLRKIMKALNNEKIKVKNEFMKPYIEFENNVKLLIETIQNAVTPLDSSIKEYEERIQKEKKEDIKTYYNSFHISDLIPFERIYDTKWNNISVSMSSVKSEIVTKTSEFEQAINVIRGMNTDKQEDAIQMYIDTLNLLDTINYINKYEQQKKEIQARYEEQRKIEQEQQLEKERQRIREEERRRIEEEQRIKETAVAQAKEEIIHDMSVKELDMSEPKRMTIFNLDITLSEFEQVTMYLDSLGIEYTYEMR